MDEMVSLLEVSAAFDRLVAHVLASSCAPEYAQTIYFAGIDVLDILRGEWDRPSAADISLWPVETQDAAAEWRPF